MDAAACVVKLPKGRLTQAKGSGTPNSTLIGGEPVKATRVMFIIMVGAMLCAETAAADDWDRYKGDCDNVLKTHKTVLLQRLKECVGMWMAYVDPSTVKPQRRQSLKESFSPCTSVVLIVRTVRRKILQ